MPYIFEKEFDHDGVLGDDGKVKRVFPVVLLGHVDVVDDFREGLEEAPRQEQVCRRL